MAAPGPRNSYLVHPASRLYRPHIEALCARYDAARAVQESEESGALAPVFTEIANRSRRSFSEWTQRLTNLLEPALILFMGIIVGAVVVVIMLSITSITDVAF